MRIGILGGSFDPIHNGHLHMAAEARREYGLDEVWITPAGHSPNKDEARMTPAEARKDMCMLACEGREGFSVCTLEVDSGEKSYTYRTLQKLVEMHPDDTFFFIMGADSLAYFKEWMHPEIISRLAKLLVVNRGGYTLDGLRRMALDINRSFTADIRFVHCDKYPVSSSEIRTGIKDGADMSGHLPQGVAEYIREHGLYS